MKTSVGLLIVMLATAPTLRPCDLCNYYQNIYPHDGQTTVGLRYRLSRYTSSGPAHAHAIKATSLHGSSDQIELYHTTELWGRWYPSSHWYIETVLPYRQNETSASPAERGIGDLVMMGHFRIVNSGTNDWNAIKQRITIGAGIKWKTGKFDPDGDSHLQTGTGSTDILMAAGYVIKRNRLGFVSNISFGVNGTNREGYHFANRVNATGSAFYQKRIGVSVLSPHAGVYFEHSGRDRFDGQPVDGTGGDILLVMGGVDVTLGRWSVMGSYQLPVRQTAHRPENTFRLITGLSYSFETIE